MRPRRELPTPAMVALDRELDGRIDHAHRRARELEDTLDRLEAEDREEDQPAVELSVEQVQAYVASRASSPQWRLVLDRIASGDLTWAVVVETMQAGTGDRDVQAALLAPPMPSSPPGASEPRMESLPPQQSRPLTDPDQYRRSR